YTTLFRSSRKKAHLRLIYATAPFDCARRPSAPVCGVHGYAHGGRWLPHSGPRRDLDALSKVTFCQKADGLNFARCCLLSSPKSPHINLRGSRGCRSCARRALDGCTRG